METKLKQVSKEHYLFLDYVDDRRWNSYFIQIKEISKSLIIGGGEILLVGIGDGIVPYLLKKIMPNSIVTTVDYDEDLAPDICCDIRELSKFVSERYDIIMCCQVLEHLKFEEIDKVMVEFTKCLVQNGKLILSLPDSGIPCAIRVILPKLHIRNYVRKWCRWYRKEFEFNGEHYWEVNSAWKYRDKKIREIISQYFIVESDYLVPNNSYHRFYVAEMK